MALAAAIYLCLSCSHRGQNQSTGSALSGPHVRTLGSGKQIKVLGIRETESPEGKTLILEYATPLGIEKHEALQREVEEIWVDFREDAERSGASVVVIEAMRAPAIGVDFSLYRNKDGSWRKSGGFAYPSPKEEPRG
jgi:hypothetical protein